MIPSIETSNKYSSVPNLLNRFDKTYGNLYILPVLQLNFNPDPRKIVKILSTVPDFLRVPHGYLSIFSTGTLCRINF